MKLQSLGLLLLPFGLGLMLGLRLWGHRTTDMVPVVLASRDLLAGTRFQWSKPGLAVVLHARGSEPPGSFRSLDELRGKVLAKNLPAGSPCTRYDIVPDRPFTQLVQKVDEYANRYKQTLAVPRARLKTGGNSPTIPEEDEDCRAILVQVDNPFTRRSRPLPGQRVDILCTFPDGDRRITKTIAQNALVLSVVEPYGCRFFPGINAPLSVGVKADEAAILIGLSEVGRFSIALRQAGDRSVMALNRSGTTSAWPQTD